jgi:AraC-like DNA-binding protein
MTGAAIALYRSQPSGGAALAVVGFGRQRIAMRVVNRRLPMHAVVLIESGNGTLSTDKAGTQEVIGPSLFWLPAGTLHSYGPLHGESWEERWALFTGSFASALIGQRLIVEAAPLVPLRNLREMQQLFAILHSEFAKDNPLSLASSAATLHRIAVQSARQAAAPGNKASDATVELAIDALQQRAFQPVDISAFAEEFAMSPATLRRRFAAATGLSPKAFQLRLRIDRAKQLLTTSDLSIEAIAATVGIDDAFYFSRLFQDRERCSPSEFRQRHRRS